MIGFVIGLVAGAWHLGLTALRARALPSRGLGVALLGLPFAWAGPVGGLYLAAQLQPDTAWLVLPGMILARVALLLPLASWVGR